MALARKLKMLQRPTTLRQRNSSSRLTTTRPAVLWACNLFILIITVSGWGCRIHRDEIVSDDRFASRLAEIEYPDVEIEIKQEQVEHTPWTLDNLETAEFWELSLEEAITHALQNSTVLHDLGGTLLRSPSSAKTKFDPALQETDPRFGVEAALSAFDASFEASAVFENNDRALNNSFFGGGTRLFKQDLGAISAQLNKKAATGADFTLRHTLDYDANNAPGNQFPSAWTAAVEGEFRQPLLQGAGVDFNRIYGPSGTLGLPRGVLIARIDSDVSIADFELGVRNFVSDVENAYWELQFAYHDLQAKKAARDRALQTWQVIRGWFVNNRSGGEADREAQAREQYYRLQADVENAVAGRPLEATSSTSFRGTGGVLSHEKRLRRLIGLAVNDFRMLRPSDEPPKVHVTHDWGSLQAEALTRRPELRRQRWMVKRRELELIGAKNFLRPQIDAVGRYRWRGFGKDLLDPNGAATPFDNAYENLTNGDFQEWQMGLEMALPIGFRQAHAGVRHAELRLRRDEALLEEQQSDVLHDLSAAVAEIERAYRVTRTNYNRHLAASEELQALETLYEDPNPDEIPRLVDRLLDTQRRLADSESQLARSRSEYALALKNLHLNKGTLLEFNGVHLSEGAWRADAVRQATEKVHARVTPWITPGASTDVISNGTTSPDITVHPREVVIEDFVEVVAD
jgi:outer membrane protein TolC